jgi:hypothetical protein
VVLNPYRGPEPIEIYRAEAVKKRLEASVSKADVSNKISRNRGLKAQTEATLKAIMMKKIQNDGK